MAARLWNTRTFPFAMALALGAITLTWNSLVGLSWNGPGLGLMLLVISPLLMIGAYGAVRGMHALSEAILCACMYMIVPLLAVRLSFLVTTLNFPLIDANLDRFDHALGFDRVAWESMIAAHPALQALISAAYMSPIQQALISTAIFSYARPALRNFEILFTLVLALIVVIGIYALLPELGPGSLINRHYTFESNILAIRAGGLGPFPYMGIASFPSFHTVMAIVFTYGHRGLRSFWPFAGLNALMLMGTPSFGDHYLADMCAGAAVAAICIMVGRTIYGDAKDGVRVVFPGPLGNPFPAR